jgi:S-adenosylmethionine hydrolase
VRPVITFLSDFGLTDPYTGICRATVIDLTHTVPALDVGRGATALADCVTVAPAAVHLAVVDPDAEARPGVVVAAGDALLVGPDNGLLLPAADALGGPRSAHRLTQRRWHRDPVSPVFRGRHVDCYGNIQLPVTARDLHRAGLDGGRPVRIGTHHEILDVRRVCSFSDLAAGELGIVEDSFGWLAIVAGGADASQRLGLRSGDAIRLGDG